MLSRCIFDVIKCNKYLEADTSAQLVATLPPKLTHCLLWKVSNSSV